MSDILGGSTFTGWATSTGSKDIVGIITSDNTTEVTFCNPGLYDWTIPSGVRYISAVLIGGGGAGNGVALGGQGGELCYFNNLDLGPSAAGSTIKVYVGNGGGSTSTTTTSWGEPSVIFDKSVTVTNANYSVITPGIITSGIWPPDINTSFSYSAIAIGGGGGGGSSNWTGSGTSTYNAGAGGGGGGGAAYINNFYPFTLTGNITLTAGNGGTANNSGGTSSVTMGSTTLVQATGGGSGSNNLGGQSNGGAGGSGSYFSSIGNGASYVGGAGGPSYNGGFQNSGGGGGGAAGPGGGGGRGGLSAPNAASTSVSNGTAASVNTGAGAGGGGGSGSLSGTSNPMVGAGGGGSGSVILFTGTSTSTGGVAGTYNITSLSQQFGKGGSGTGAGSIGTNGTYLSPNTTISLSSPATGGNGGSYGGGGGGGGGYSTYPVGYGGTGGNGAVAIIWPGVTRTFPSTNIASYTTVTYWITVNSSSTLPFTAGMPIYFDQAIGPLTANTVYLVTSNPNNFKNATNFYYFQIANIRSSTTTLPAATYISTASVNIYYSSNIARGGNSTGTYPSIKTGVSNTGGTTSTGAGGCGAGGYTGIGGNGGYSGAGDAAGGGASSGSFTGGGGIGLYGTTTKNVSSGNTGTVPGGGGSFGYNSSSSYGGLFGGGGGVSGLGGSGAIRIVWGGKTFPNNALPSNSVINQGSITSNPNLLSANTLVNYVIGPTTGNYAIATLNNVPFATGKSSFTVGAGTVTVDTTNLNTIINSTSIPVPARTSNYQNPNRTDTSIINQSQEPNLATSTTIPTNARIPTRTDTNDNISKEINQVTSPRSDGLNTPVISNKNLSTDEIIVNSIGWG